MKTEFERSFLKALEQLKSNKPLISKIYNVLEGLAQAADLSSVPNVKKLAGYKDYYRIRLGDYRLGFKYNGEVVRVIAIAHRKDIYRYFP